MSFTSLRRDLGLIVGARAVSLFGDQVATVALVLRLQERGAGAGAIAALLAANLAPIVLLSGIAVRLVDARDNRQLLVMSGLAQAAVCSALIFATTTPAVLALVALLGAGQAFTGAAWQALLPAAVPPDQLARAVGLGQAALTVAGIAAPAVGGLLVGLYGPKVPLLIDAVSFLAVAIAALFVHTRRAPAVDDGTRPHGGLSIVRRNPVLRSAIPLMVLFILLGAAVNVVEVFLVRETLHANALWYGLTGAGYAVGILPGTVFARRFRARAAQSRALVLSAAALGIGLVGMGLSPDVGTLLAVGLATGFANGVLSVCVSTLIMGVTDPSERGRVGAVVAGAFSAAELTAYAAGGGLAVVLDPRTIFVCAGLLGLLAPALLGRALITAVRSIGEPTLSYPAAAATSG